MEAATASDIVKHTKGLAIEFTWEGWAGKDSLVVAKALYNTKERSKKYDAVQTAAYPSDSLPLRGNRETIAAAQRQ